MTGLSFKSAVFSLRRFGCSRQLHLYRKRYFRQRFRGFLSLGPSFSISSAAPGGPNFDMGMCTQRTLCTIPVQFIPTTPSLLLDPGDLGQATVGGVKAGTLAQRRLTFSGFSLTAVTDSEAQFFGSGPVTFTGDLTGHVFVPLGCEAQPGSGTDVGPQVLHLQLSAVPPDSLWDRTCWMGRN